MSDIALPSRGVSELPFVERLASDERLARLVSRGSAQAFAVLYTRHHRALSRYCRAIVRDEQDAQDVLQSAMMRALAALQAGERKLTVRPWLFRIVHNEAISLLRRRRLDDVPVDEYVPARGGVERTVQTRERLALLVADLQALPERQRAALVMRELSGLSIDEIAQALVTSPGAAKQTLFEARCALHELAEGRAMQCETARELISERDGRVLRGRKLRAHLRACVSCREFRASIGVRSADLRALAPSLPAAAASPSLAQLLAGGGHTGGVAAATSSASLGGPAAATLTVKALAGVVLATAATAGTIQLVTSVDGHRSRSPALLRVATSMHGAAATPGSAHAPSARMPRVGVNAGVGMRAAGGSPLGAGSIVAGTPATQGASGHARRDAAAVRAHPGWGARGHAGAHSRSGRGASRGRGHAHVPSRAHPPRTPARHGDRQPPAGRAAPHEHEPPATSGATHPQGHAGAGGTPAVPPTPAHGH